MNILEEIAAKTRERVAEAKNKVSLEEMKQKAESLNADTGFPFENAIKEGSLSFICEAKKASPSKGLIAEDFPYVEIAKEYEKGGASAISVLTEPFWFMGSNEYLKEIREEVNIPIIRKDFTVDEYMIYEAKVIGADAVLLICAILDDESLKKYMQIADSLGLSALVETHDEEEVKRAVAAGARPVSYTHLDVYKRQDNVRVQNKKFLTNQFTRVYTFKQLNKLKPLMWR